MKDYILGYPIDADIVKENLQEYDSKSAADYNTDEWVIVPAESLEEAKDKYEDTFVAWQNDTGARISQKRSDRFK